MKLKQVEELILQALEHEMGGIKVYSTALRCALNPELKEEWQTFFQQTHTHVTALERVCTTMGIDREKVTAGRLVVRHTGAALVKAMEMALEAGEPPAAELVACECVVLAETKDHANWELLGKCGEQLQGEQAKVVMEAYEEIEDQEDEHLYHTKGWARELWLQSLGLKAALPPPEKVQRVKTAIGAARAQQGASQRR